MQSKYLPHAGGTSFSFCPLPLIPLLGSREQNLVHALNQLCRYLYTGSCAGTSSGGCGGRQSLLGHGAHAAAEAAPGGRFWGRAGYETGAGSADSRRTRWPGCSQRRRARNRPSPEEAPAGPSAQAQPGPASRKRHRLYLKRARSGCCLLLPAGHAAPPCRTGCPTKWVSASPGPAPPCSAPSPGRGGRGVGSAASAAAAPRWMRPRGGGRRVLPTAEPGPSPLCAGGAAAGEGGSGSGTAGFPLAVVPLSRPGCPVPPPPLGVLGGNRLSSEGESVSHPGTFDSCALKVLAGISVDLKLHKEPQFL